MKLKHLLSCCLSCDYIRIRKGAFDFCDCHVGALLNEKKYCKLLNLLVGRISSDVTPNGCSIIVIDMNIEDFAEFGL